MNLWKVAFAALFTTLLITSCSVSTKSRREADLEASRFDGFVAGCTFAANGVASQLGLSIEPDVLAKICRENAAK